MDPQLLKKLMGFQDSRGPVGMYSRGTNVYNGTTNSAHIGGGAQFGRPPNQPPQRPTTDILQRYLQAKRSGIR